MDSTEWKIADAKNRLSEVLNRADMHTPQIIRRHSKEYVVISGEDYRALTGDKPDFLDVLMNGPSLEGVDLERDKSPMREIDL